MVSHAVLMELGVKQQNTGLRVMTQKKASQVGQKGYTGNKNGRPVDKLKGLTPSELKQALSKLKKATPFAIDVIVAYVETTEGSEQARAAKELINLYLSMDRHAVSRAESMQRILKVVDKDETNTDNADSAFDEPDKAPVFSLKLKQEE